MPKTSSSYNAKPYIATSLALIMSVILIIDTFFIKELESYWSAALWFCLMLTLLAMAVQIARAENNLKNFDEQLSTSKERLTNEIKHRLWAEKTASESKVKSQFIDENIPVMLAYFNVDLRCRYHNRIFRRWFGLKPDQIDGQPLQSFSSEEFFSSIKNSTQEIFTGKTIHSERVLKSTKGFPYIFTEQYIPHIDSKGKTVGFYTLHTPRAQEKNRIASPNNIISPSNPELLKIGAIEKKITTRPVNQAPQSGVTAARIVQAIEGGEFNLYCQQISSIKTDPTTSPPFPHYEVLIRMNEEENNLMPPGSFLPFVNQFGMMPKLDRWIVEHIVQWLSANPTTNTIFCLNVAHDTLSDQDFPIFVKTQLQNMNVPATSLCFEIEVSDAEANLNDLLEFSKKIHKLGCLLSLCSYNHSSTAANLLTKFKIDYLKIDGSLVCNILSDEEDLEKIITINSIAHQMKIRTIAELVESDDVIAKLGEIGVDFAQGFGIARPIPLKDL